MIDQAIYPYDTVTVECQIKDGFGNDLATNYNVGDVASNPAAGYGKAWVTIFNAYGAIAFDANGLQLKNQYMNRSTLNSGNFVYAVGPGLLQPGEYEAHPAYGVQLAGGTLDWRKQTIIKFKVAMNPNVIDQPVS